jgi:hypothetical protein
MQTKQKRLYERPTMQVVELKKHAPLICTSGEGLDDYNRRPGQDW